MKHLSAPIPRLTSAPCTPASPTPPGGVRPRPSCASQAGGPPASRTAALPELPPVMRWFTRGGTVPPLLRREARAWLDGFVAFLLARRRRESTPAFARIPSPVERLVGAWDAVDPWASELLRRPDPTREARRRGRRAALALATHALAARRRRQGGRGVGWPPRAARRGRLEEAGGAWMAQPDDTVPDAWALRLL